ncbi:hypothetical protein IEQ34_005392 [Dendrobium chrysotoxum]|uniref:Uncharacterized protein n=1 Tax=Dendrobium chrysotoxum TaxID=161865 RepID=A0AAV7HC44_DENCH|nr:hypothetical protein IEQ34_005392 [Dendrobium chrysotoxum]
MKFIIVAPSLSSASLAPDTRHFFPLMFYQFRGSNKFKCHHEGDREVGTRDRSALEQDVRLERMDSATVARVVGFNGLRSCWVRSAKGNRAEEVPAR